MDLISSWKIKQEVLGGQFIFLSNKNEIKAAETRAADKVIGVYCARTICNVFTGLRGENQIPVTALTQRGQKTSR